MGAQQVEATPRAGPILALWMALMVLFQGVLWLSGAKGVALSGAVESGAAKAESRGIGELGDDVIRKAIQSQQATLPFWTTLALFGDFVVGPLGLVIRATLVAVLFSGLAALSGRPLAFGEGLAGSAKAQGFWVLGLAVHAALVAALRRPDVELSPVLLLPPGRYEAATLVTLQQFDAFALLGWLALARGGWKRNQVRPVGALLVCGLLWLIESILRISLALFVGAGMRLTLIPETL